MHLIVIAYHKQNTVHLRVLVSSWLKKTLHQCTALAFKGFLPQTVNQTLTPKP